MRRFFYFGKKQCVVELRSLFKFFFRCVALSLITNEVERYEPREGTKRDKKKVKIEISIENFSVAHNFLEFGLGRLYDYSWKYV